MKYENIEKIISISTENDNQTIIVDDNFTSSGEISVEKVNELLENEWKLLAINYEIYEQGARISNYILGKPKK